MLAEKTNFTITRMVRFLEVSRSGYYAWVGRPPSPASIRRVHIEQKVTFFHGDPDEVYGAPRILADLRADGEIISRKTVAVTMRRLTLTKQHSEAGNHNTHGDVAVQARRLLPASNTSRRR